MKKQGKSIISVVLILVMTLTMAFTFAGCSAGNDGKDGITPQLRINDETNYWEVSYDEGESWESMGVLATGPAGQDGKDGVNGVDGKDGIDGKDGVDGKDGIDGKDGADGTDGKDGKDFTVNDIMSFINFLKIYGKTDLNFTLDEMQDLIDEYKTFKVVATLMDDARLGNADFAGTQKCFASVYFRPLVDDHGYYNNSSRIASYLNGVFTEDANGNVSVAANSSLKNASYRCESLTVVNFALAFNGYEEYAVRNDLALPANIAKQKELAIKYFNTVNEDASGYHTAQNVMGYTFPSQALSNVALGSLLGQAGTARYDALIKDAYDNLDTNFYRYMVDYITPFYQLCSDYSWFDTAKIPAVETLTDNNILVYYGYGIDLAKDHAALWTTWVEDALADNSIDAGEAKAFAYHYAYQITDGEVDLGAYGSSRAIVDYDL